MRDSSTLKRFLSWRQEKAWLSLNWLFWRQFMVSWIFENCSTQWRVKNQSGYLAAGGAGVGLGWVPPSPLPLSFCLREWGKKVTVLPYRPRICIVARGRGALLAAKGCDWGFWTLPLLPPTLPFKRFIKIPFFQFFDSQSFCRPTIRPEIQNIFSVLVVVHLIVIC